MASVSTHDNSPFAHERVSSKKRLKRLQEDLQGLMVSIEWTFKNGPNSELGGACDLDEKLRKLFDDWYKTQAQIVESVNDPRVSAVDREETLRMLSDAEMHLHELKGRGFQRPHTEVKAPSRTESATSQTLDGLDKELKAINREMEAVRSKLVYNGDSCEQEKLGLLTAMHASLTDAWKELLRQKKQPTPTNKEALSGAKDDSDKRAQDLLQKQSDLETEIAAESQLVIDLDQLIQDAIGNERLQLTLTMQLTAAEKKRDDAVLALSVCSHQAAGRDKQAEATRNALKEMEREYRRLCGKIDEEKALLRYHKEYINELGAALAESRLDDLLQQATNLHNRMEPCYPKLH